MLFGSGQSFEVINLILLKYFFAILRIFFLSEKETMGKIIFPFLFKCFLPSFKTFDTSNVPSSPQSQGILFVYHGEIPATFFAIPETDSTIISNFLFFHG